MRFTASLLASATLIASSVAQSGSCDRLRPTFTTLPSSPVRAGSSIDLAWSGADDESVTIFLQQGDSDNLASVPGSAGLVTGNGESGTFTWDVPSSLPERDDYALRIQRNNLELDADCDINYTGQFRVTGGSPSSSSSSSSSSRGRTVVAGTASSSSAISEYASSLPSTIAPSAANATTTRATLLPTGAVGTGASGTGASMSRNTTMSRASLSRTSSSASTSETATSTSGSDEATSTDSETAPSSQTGTAISLASNFALLFAAVIGVIYLG